MTAVTQEPAGLQVPSGIFAQALSLAQPEGIQFPLPWVPGSLQPADAFITSGETDHTREAAAFPVKVPRGRLEQLGLELWCFSDICEISSSREEKLGGTQGGWWR